MRINALELVGPHSPALRFNDGTRRRVDLLPELEGSIFKPLRDPAYFSRVVLDPIGGTVVWPNGVNLAPDFLRELPEEMVMRRHRKSSESARQRADRLATRGRLRLPCTDTSENAKRFGTYVPYSL
jgi:hypothetical protein